MFFICLDSIAFSFSVIGYWSQSLNSNDKISENSLNYDHFLEWLTALIVFSVRKSSFVPWFRAHWRSKDVCTSFEKIIQRRQWIIPECHSFYCDAHKYCLIFIKICIQWFSGMLSSFPMTIFFSEYAWWRCITKIAEVCTAYVFSFECTYVSIDFRFLMICLLTALVWIGSFYFNI